MKTHLPLCLLACFATTFSVADARDRNATDTTDGAPYVWRIRDSFDIKQLDNGKIKEQRFSLKEISTHPVQVNFADHPEWNFSFLLRQKIENENPNSSGADKMLFVSDIEGEFDAFRGILIANKVIDEKYNWTFGNGQLVICGDLFDRGLNVTEELWLLYKLEDEAKAAGGYVHTILGNHDIMNLSGDIRYVQHKYFQSAATFGIPYNSFFSDSTELGKWLRSKNVIEKIGKHLCLHAGVSAFVNNLQYNVALINKRVRPFYSKTGDDKLPDDVDLLTGENGVFWYRGYFAKLPARPSQVDSTLQLFNTNDIIVGHDIVDSIMLLYGGKVIAIDVNEHENNTQGLLIDKKDYWIVDRSGKRQSLL
jgi:hypothetical protein